MKRDKIDLLLKILTKMKAAVLVAEVEAEVVVVVIGEEEWLLRDVDLEVGLEVGHLMEVQTEDHLRAITVKRLAI